MAVHVYFIVIFFIGINDMTNDEKVKNTRLRCEALDALKDAQHKMFKYAANCELGEEREKAFAVYEQIRTAPMAGS